MRSYPCSQLEQIAETRFHTQVQGYHLVGSPHFVWIILNLILITRHIDRNYEEIHAWFFIKYCKNHTLLYHQKWR